MNVVDANLAKVFPLGKERKSITLRMEAFNLMNHPYYAAPGHIEHDDSGDDHKRGEADAGSEVRRPLRLLIPFGPLRVSLRLLPGPRPLRR